MDLPPEILIKIFMHIPVDNIQAVSDTCTYWQNIVENYDIWKAHWIKLLCTSSKTNLKESLHSKLERMNYNNLKQSCVRLKNVLYDSNNKIYDCLLKNPSFRYLDYAVLITRYSKVMIAATRITLSSYKNKDCDMLFRKPPKLLDAIYSVVNGLNHQRHIGKLCYVYPLGITPHLNEIISVLLERCHVEEVVLIPRVLALCSNLDVADALVVISGSRSTEISFVVAGKVEKFREVSVGGWNLANYLHIANKWRNPNDKGGPGTFDSPGMKKKCLLAVKKTYRETQEELHVGPELMYSELNLATIVEELSAGFPTEQLSRCLSHVLLAGGNCKLQHMCIRIRLDLMDLFPEHAQIISTSVHTDLALLYTPPLHSEEITRVAVHQHILN